jgi:hypothetical protein
MHALHFSDKLPQKYNSDAERIFYFNINQKKHLTKILENVEKFGSIKIVNEGDSLHLLFNGKDRFSELFVFDSKSETGSLLGMLIYRIRDDICEILHIAVDESCAFGGLHYDERVTFRLIEKLKEKMVKDSRINKIKLPYNKILLQKNRKLDKFWD